MKLARLMLVLALILSIGMVSIPASAEGDITTVRVMGTRFRSGLYDLDRVGEYETWQVFNQMLLEKGVQIEFEPIADEQYKTVVNTRLASGTDLPDLFAFTGSQSDAIAYGNSGIFVDMAAAIEKYDEDGSIFAFWNEYYPAARGQITTESGAMYWVPNLTGVKMTGELKELTAYPGNRMVLCLRRDWMDKLGIEYVYEAITMDEAYEIMKAFREQDANGNGVQDEVVNVDISSFANGFAQMFGLPFDLATLNNSTGEINSPWYMEDQLVDYIEFMKQLIADGLYDTSVIGNGGVGDTLIAENKVGVVWTYLVETWIEGANRNQYPDMLYSPILPLTDYTPVLEARDVNGTVNGMFVVPSTSENVEGVVKLLDVIYTPEVDRMNSYGLEGKGYVVNEDGSFTRHFGYSAFNADPYGTQGGPLEWCTQVYPATRLTYNTEKSVMTAISSLPGKSEFNAWLFTEGKDLHQMQINGNDYYALPTNEEIERLNEIQTTLKTFSTETITKLILGEYAVEDIPTYVEQLRALGLDDYIEILEARYERAMAANG